MCDPLPSHLGLSNSAEDSAYGQVAESGAAADAANESTHIGCQRGSRQIRLPQRTPSAARPSDMVPSSGDGHEWLPSRRRTTRRRRVGEATTS